MPRRSLTPVTLPAEAADLVQLVGRAVRQARLRRSWSQQALADHAGVSDHIVQSVEAGQAGTSVGSVFAILWALRLTGPLHALADPAADREGRALETLTARRRAARSSAAADLDTDF